MSADLPWEVIAEQAAGVCGAQFMLGFLMGFIGIGVGLVAVGIFVVRRIVSTAVAQSEKRCTEDMDRRETEMRESFERELDLRLQVWDVKERQYQARLEQMAPMVEKYLDLIERKGMDKIERG